MMRLARIALLIVLSFATPALAENVSVRSGDQIGQGWASRFNSYCLVVTAGHLIEGKTAEVAGPGGIRGTAVAIIRHPTLDLAILSIEGPLKTACPSSGFGFRDTRPALSAARSGQSRLAVEVAGEAGGTTTIFAVIDSIDATEPVFQVRTAEVDIDLLGAGDSGAAVLEYGAGGGLARQPLGIVVEEIGPRIARAVRFDQARALIETQFSDARPTVRPQVALAKSLPVELIDYRGKIVSADCGPTDTWAGLRRCTFEFAGSAPNDHPTLVVAPAKGGDIGRVTIVFSSTYTGRGVSIETSDRDAREDPYFTPNRFCTLNSEFVASCALTMTSPRSIRLVFDGAAVIKSISFEGARP